MVKTIKEISEDKTDFTTKESITEEELKLINQMDNNTNTEFNNADALQKLGFLDTLKKANQKRFNINIRGVVVNVGSYIEVSTGKNIIKGYLLNINFRWLCFNILDRQGIQHTVKLNKVSILGFDLIGSMGGKNEEF